MSYPELRTPTSQESIGADRRRSIRFPFQAELKFRLLSKRLNCQEGTGVVVDFSSGGVLFRTASLLPIGTAVQLAIGWPAKLDGQHDLKMMARGRVVRFQNGLAAVEIMTHEFRTIGRNGLTL